MRHRLQGLASAALAALLLSGCEKAPAPGPQAASPADAVAGQLSTFELGRKVYNFRCYFCHGYSGDAKTLATTYLTPPPRDFTSASPASLPLEAILAALRHGRPGTAMKSFTGIIDETELQAVAAFVAAEFVRDKAPNTAYHTAQNGWPDHERLAIAFPFATGAIKLDTPVESLTAEQLRGRRLFLTTCVSCHDRAHVDDEGPAWSSRPLSYPRMGFVPGQTTPVDAASGASVYALHDVVPQIENLSPTERRGEALYQGNCAFCHGADGTGKNWIGQFMEPKARDLTMFTPQSMPKARLVETIREGLVGTSMPAWKSVLQPAEIEDLVAYVTRAFMRPDAPATTRR